MYPRTVENICEEHREVPESSVSMSVIFISRKLSVFFMAHIFLLVTAQLRHRINFQYKIEKNVFCKNYEEKLCCL